MNRTFPDKYIKSEIWISIETSCIVHETFIRTTLTISPRHPSLQIIVISIIIWKIIIAIINVINI